jgi:hypothetical protein
MFYKVGLEVFNGSMETLAADRFEEAETFTKRAFLPHVQSPLRLTLLHLSQRQSAPPPVLIKLRSV